MLNTAALSWLETDGNMLERVRVMTHAIFLCCSQLSCLKWSFSRYSSGISCSSCLPLRCNLSKHFWTKRKQQTRFFNNLKQQVDIFLLCGHSKESVKCREYLWWSSEVNNPVQLDVLAKLVVEPAVQVLVDGPFSLIEALALVKVGSKDVPETRGGQDRSH